VLITPALIGLIAVAEPFLRLWLGAEIAVAATPVSYILAGGFWIYCIAHMAYTMLQATGRPDLVSKILIAELIPYCMALVAGMWLFGVIGAAYAFTLRAAFDSAVFLRVAKVPFATIRMLAIPAMLTLLSIVAASCLAGAFRYSAFAALMFASIIWSLFNTPDVLRGYFRKLGLSLPKRKTQSDGAT
jgi:O-antigen/teichoic acid export membrane protein